MLAGPQGLHEMLPTRLAEVNALRKQFSDAQLEADREAFPEIRRKKPPRKGRDTVEIPGRLAQLITAGLAPIRQLRPARELSREFPEVEIRAMDAKWYRLASYDSAVVSMNDGTSAALYRRDPDKFRELAQATAQLHERWSVSGRGWPQEYRAALADVTSPETWEETFRPWTDGARTAADDRRADAGGRARRRSATTSRTCRWSTRPPRAVCVGVLRRRYLLRLMVRRELRARYIGSKMGLLWSYINPFSRFLTFYFVFGIILRPRPDPALRDPPVRRHGRGEPVHRVLQLRHPLDHAEQVGGAEDAAAARDLPDLLDAGLALPHRPADGDPRSGPAWRPARSRRT